MTKYFITGDYNKFTDEILDVKIKKCLVDKSDKWGFINNSDLDKKKRSKKTELNAEQDKTKKLQTYDSSLFIRQSYFGDGESENFNQFTKHSKHQLVFQTQF